MLLSESEDASLSEDRGIDMCEPAADNTQTVPSNHGHTHSHAHVSSLSAWERGIVIYLRQFRAESGGKLKDPGNP